MIMRVVTMLCLGLPLTSCSGERAVKLVFPKDHAGPLAICVDPSITKEDAVRSGSETVVMFNNSGVAWVRSSDFLSEWANWIYMDGTGNQVTDVHGGATVRLSHVEISAIIWFFRGHPAQAQEFIWGRDSEGLQRSWLHSKGLK